MYDGVEESARTPGARWETKRSSPIWNKVPGQMAARKADLIGNLELKREREEASRSIYPL